MTIIHDMSLRDFEPWSGAIRTYNDLAHFNKLDELESIIEEFYPEGLTETELNDLLWFEPEEIGEWVGLEYDSEKGEFKDTTEIKN